MIILKFGGKSLASSHTFDKVLEIVKTKAKAYRLAIIVSAIGDTTDILERILDQARNDEDYSSSFKAFQDRDYHQQLDLRQELGILKKLYAGVNLLGDYNLKVKDQILAQGELISSKIIAYQLNKQGLKAIPVDSRKIFISDRCFGNAQVLETPSKAKTQAFFQNLPPDHIAVVTGFIGATEKGETTTFGRNGSNYSASLLANFLQAKELQNYTHVDGIFTANPEWVKAATKIEELSFNDANELANFGASILHAKTILPLVKSNIPLRILNTLNPDNSGTLISGKTTEKGIKSLSIKTDVALIKLEGRGLLGTVGVDSRIFSTMARENINVGVISQGSSERGIGYIVADQDAQKAAQALKKEFQNDFYAKDVDSIEIQKDLAVISIVGQELKDFDLAYSALVRHHIVPVLFNTAITGMNVSLVVKKEQAKKALNVLHQQLFKTHKTVNIALFGCGSVGGTLIHQIQAEQEKILKEEGIDLHIFAIANSKKALLCTAGFTADWKTELETKGAPYTVETIIEFAQDHLLENCIAIDNTASLSFIEHYIPLVEKGFHLISSNKMANAQPYPFYAALRKTLQKYHKRYRYEANVGAGLPLIDTLRLLHQSGEKILKIRGVFSGSLSYIFNTFSDTDTPFSKIIRAALEKGFTEPDPREDLSGQDVGRKLLILARELGATVDLDAADIQSLIPSALQSLSATDFLAQLENLDLIFKKLKEDLAEDQVLQYVGELQIQTAQSPTLEAKLASFPRLSPIGRLQGSETIFEIFTENYLDYPLIIQGHGAGAEVTARGVFSDLLKLSTICH